MFNTNGHQTDVKEKILVSSRDLFIKKGYKGTSIREIASYSGTSVAMVNYYFHSKYDLFEIIFDEALDVLMQKLMTTLKGDLPLTDVIKLWIHSYFEVFSQYPHIPIFILNEVSLNPEKLTSSIKNKDPYNLYLQIAERIEKESKTCNIRKTSPAHLILNILSLCMYPFMFSTLATSLMKIDMKEYKELLRYHENYVIDFVINSLKINNNKREDNE